MLKRHFSYINHAYVQDTQAYHLPLQLHVHIGKPAISLNDFLGYKVCSQQLLSKLVMNKR